MWCINFENPRDDKIFLAFKALKLLIILSLLTHDCACIWIYLGITTDNGWLSDFDWRADGSEAYLNAHYFVVETFTTVGYGDYGASSNEEVWFLMFIELLGVMIFAAIMGELQTFK